MEFKNEITCKDILEKFPNLVEFFSGDQETKASFPSPPWNVKKGSLTFIHKPEYLVESSKSKAIVVVSKSLFEKASFKKPPTESHCFLVAKNIKLAMAKICSHFFSLKDYEFFDGLRDSKGERKRDFIHPTAVISDSAKIASQAQIGPYVVIERNVEILEKTSIGSHTFIGKGAKIGRQTYIHPQVYIAPSSIIGNECEVQPLTSIGSEGYGYATDEKGKHHRVPHYGRVILEDLVSIGSNVSIDRGTFEDTRIGKGTKIDNHAHIAHNVQIGKDCVIAGGFISAGSVTIGDRCYIGGRATIKGHLQITDDVHLASLSAVSNSIRKKGIYGGTPLLQPLKEALKSIGVFPYLPKMRKNIKLIMKKMNLDQRG